jgi:hypothetical protein
LDRIGVVLSTWHTHPTFSGAYGLPLDLDISSTANSTHPNQSFDKLIEVACANFPVAVTLDELLGQGAVEIIDNKLVRCRQRLAKSVGTDAGNTSVLDQYGRFLETASSTAAHNLMNHDQKSQYFYRMVVSDIGLSDRVCDDFASHAAASSEAFLYALDGWLQKHNSNPEQNSNPRYGVSVFFFKDKEADSIKSSETAVAPRN